MALYRDGYRNRSEAELGVKIDWVAKSYEVLLEEDYWLVPIS